jgi:hypothetical protein
MIQQYSSKNSEHRYSLAIASYNAGPQAVAHYGGIPPFAETRSYVTHVMALWHNLQAKLPNNGIALPTIARITTRAVESSRKVVQHLLAPKAGLAGSVAEFAALDAGSMREYVAYTAAQPAPPERKTLKRWFNRALGLAKH